MLETSVTFILYFLKSVFRRQCWRQVIQLSFTFFNQVMNLFFTFFIQSIADNVGDKFYSCSLLSLNSLLQIMLETSFTVVHYFLESVFY